MSRNGISDVLYKSACAHAVAGVELLCPYYDFDVFDYVQFLPTKYKFRRLYGKYLQKKLLYRRIPRHVLERPKRGFVMDFVEFGIEPIRSLTDKYLNRKRLSETGLVNPDFAIKCVEDFYRGDTNMGPKLWTLLMFELWREKFSI